MKVLKRCNDARVFPQRICGYLLSLLACRNSASGFQEVVTQDEGVVKEVAPQEEGMVKEVAPQEEGVLNEVALQE